MSFHSMTANGVIKFTFSQEMKVPESKRFLRQIDSAVLDVTIQPEAGADPKNYDFTWNVTDF